MNDRPDVGIFLPNLRGGGAERVMANLARGLAGLGLRVDLVLVRAEGEWLDAVPPGIRVVDLRSRRVATSLPGLVRYLRGERPGVLLSALGHTNLAAVLARRLGGVSTRVAVSVHSVIRPASPCEPLGKRARLTGWLACRCYRWADSILAVSEGVASGLAEASRLPRSRIRVTPNAVVTPELRQAASRPLDHPWFAPGAAPVILGAGTLYGVKNFPLLIRAFAALRSRREARLVILGQGPDRERLLRLAEALGVAADVELPGFTTNPYRYFARARVFALSSDREGLPTVLIEALACGARVVATDCPSGPREILHGGRYGYLTPPGDEAALARALEAVLDDEAGPPDEQAWRPYVLETAAAQVAGELGLGR